MSPEDPYQAYQAATAQGRAQLAAMRRQALAGQVPQPAELEAARTRAHANVQALAAFLEIDGHQDEAAVDQAGLLAYEEAMELCLELTRFSLDLTRTHGPAYLVLPGEAQ